MDYWFNIMVNLHLLRPNFLLLPLFLFLCFVSWFFVFVIVCYFFVSDYLFNDYLYANILH